MKKLVLLSIFCVLFSVFSLQGKKIEINKYDRFETRFSASTKDNPFNVALTAVFTQLDRQVTVDGFYAGNGQWAIRFMPDSEGEWTYRTTSDLPKLNGKTGSFTCVAARPGVHGPVRVTQQTRFQYDDGTHYMPFGTTCYCWNHQGAQLEEQTLQTLAFSPFNKLRMCTFPKNYTFNHNAPEHYVFEQNEDGSFDYTRFDLDYFERQEALLDRLAVLGIEADIILFHPYDRWGFSRMSREIDERYLKYYIARISSFANVWWSMANEYDLMDAKTDADFDFYFQLTQTLDPYGHLRSIHNGHHFYDHTKPYVSHVSIQSHDLYRTSEWLKTYNKPIVYDECGYEGDITHFFGNLTAIEMTHRMMIGFLLGGYVGHGETYDTGDEVLWWSKGGTLRGDSPAMIAFLRAYLERNEFFLARFIPGPDGELGIDIPACIRGEKGYLCYLGNTQSAYKDVKIPKGRWRVEAVDVINGTVTDLGVFEGESFRIKLPEKTPYLAIGLYED